MEPWRILSRRVVYGARPYLEVSVEAVRLPDGRTIEDYHQIDAGSSATVVAEQADGRILLLRQYRHGVRRIGLALPGGRLDPGEEPLAAARRELLEETGYVARVWRQLPSYSTSCSYGFGVNHYFHAAGLVRQGAPKSDDLEQSEVAFYDCDQAIAALRRAEFVSVGQALPLALFLLDQSNMQVLLGS